MSSDDQYEQQQPGVLGGAGHQFKNVHKLTLQQEAYCRGRARGMTPAEAIQAAEINITQATAYTWERKYPQIRARISDLSEKASQSAILSTGLTRGFVIEKLMTVVNRCLQEEPVFDRQGNPTGEYKFDSSGANTALRMLGDTLGMFKQVAPKTPQDEMTDIPNDELTRLIGELATQVTLLEASTGKKEASRSEQIIDVQAVSETDGIPQLGGDVSREVVQSR